MITDVDIRRVYAWNSTPLIEVQKCIHQLFEDQAALNPDAEAIVCEDGSFTYSETNSMATRLSSYLNVFGVGAGQFVPICFEKSVWNVVAMLAILKTGAAFVPLDSFSPIARLSALVSSLEAKVSNQTASMPSHLYR